MLNADIILLIILGGFVLYGFWFGLIHALGGLIGVVVASIVASRLYVPIGAWAIHVFGGNDNLMRILAFTFIFIIVTRLVGFVFWIGEKVFKFISVLPFLKTINRMAGALLGLLEGLFLVGGIIFVIALFPVPGTAQRALQNSNVARRLVNTYRVLTPLLPKALRDFDPKTYFPNLPEIPPPPLNTPQQ